MRSVDEVIAANIDDRPARLDDIADWIDEYIDAYGKRPPARHLDMLADYILREELADDHPDKMSREEYPIMSEWQRTRRLKVRYLVGAAEIDYSRTMGYRKAAHVDEDGAPRESRQRLIAYPS